MEEKDFNQSLKNIPFGARKEYTKQLTHSLRKTIFSMRWAAAFYLGILESSDMDKDMYNQGEVWVPEPGQGPLRGGAAGLCLRRHQPH